MSSIEGSPAAAVPAQARAVLDFWFGAPDDPAHGRPREQWFRKDAAFDAQIRTRFGALIDDALAGALDGWCGGAEGGVTSPQGALALLLVLDQFTRNAGRDTARAFAGDPRALQVAERLVASGQDRLLGGVQRQFVYLPFEHAESLPAQREALRLFAQLERDEPALRGLLDWAQRHHDIIERFGRFPHRNAALGRESTAEELAFLQTPGSGF